MRPSTDDGAPSLCSNSAVGLILRHSSPSTLEANACTPSQTTDLILNPFNEVLKLYRMVSIAESRYIDLKIMTNRLWEDSEFLGTRRQN